MTSRLACVLSLLLLGVNESGAVVCEGTVNDNCNGLNGTCTDTGLCVVGPDGVLCEATSDNTECGDAGVTGIGDTKAVVVTTEISTVPTSNPVEYDCMFINRWSAATHPTDYPGNAHWSRPVIASHSDAYQMWAPGVQATAGVQSVAETGGVSTLRNELNAQGANVLSTSIGSNQFNSDTQQQTVTGIQIDGSHPYVSTITMVAPSPDWFSGFYDFDASDGNGFWYQRFVLDSFPWDAGTDSGSTFTSGNQETNPQVPIFQLTVNVVSQSMIFLSPDGQTVLPVATWDCSIAAIAPTIPPADPPTSSPSMSPSPGTDPPTTDPPTTDPPTTNPSVSPSLAPSPTVAATLEPSSTPSQSPSVLSSSEPSKSPSAIPTPEPTTAMPTPEPTTLEPSVTSMEHSTSTWPSTAPSDSGGHHAIVGFTMVFAICAVVTGFTI